MTKESKLENKSIEHAQWHFKEETNREHTFVFEHMEFLERTVLPSTDYRIELACKTGNC